MNPTKPALVTLINSPTRSLPTTVTVDTLGHIGIKWADGTENFYSSSGVALPLNLIAPSSTGHLANGDPVSSIPGKTGWDINPNQPNAVE